MFNQENNPIKTNCKRTNVLCCHIDCLAHRGRLNCLTL